MLTSPTSTQCRRSATSADRFLSLGVRVPPVVPVGVACVRCGRLSGTLGRNAPGPRAGGQLVRQHVVEPGELGPHVGLDLVQPRDLLRRLVALALDVGRGPELRLLGGGLGLLPQPVRGAGGGRVQLVGLLAGRGELVGDLLLALLQLGVALRGLLLEQRSARDQALLDLVAVLLGLGAGLLDDRGRLPATRACAPRRPPARRCAAASRPGTRSCLPRTAARSAPTWPARRAARARWPRRARVASRRWRCASASSSFSWATSLRRRPTASST